MVNMKIDNTYFMKLIMEYNKCWRIKFFRQNVKIQKGTINKISKLRSSGNTVSGVYFLTTNCGNKL